MLQAEKTYRFLSISCKYGVFWDGSALLMLRQVTILFAVSWSAYLDSFSFLVIMHWYELGSSLFILCKTLVTSCSLKERVTQTHGEKLVHSI